MLPGWPSSSHPTTSRRAGVTRDHPQQVHFDVMVDDKAEADARVRALGALPLTPDEEDSDVYADPAGHLFCLINRPSWAPPVRGS